MEFSEYFFNNYLSLYNKSIEISIEIYLKIYCNFIEEYSELQQWKTETKSKQISEEFQTNYSIF